MKRRGEETEIGREKQERRGQIKGKKTRGRERMKMRGGDEKWTEVERRSRNGGE